MCMADGADDDYIKVDDRHTVTAWKRRCGDCGRRIARGERFRRVEWAEIDWEASEEADHTDGVPLGNGRRLVTVQCAHCEIAAGWLNAVCGGFLYDGVCEDLFNHWDEDPLYCTLGLGRMVVASRRHWKLREPSAEEYAAHHWRGWNVPGELVPLEMVGDWLRQALQAHARRRLAHGDRRAA